MKLGLADVGSDWRPKRRGKPHLRLMSLLIGADVALVAEHRFDDPFLGVREPYMRMRPWRLVRDYRPYLSM